MRRITILIINLIIILAICKNISFAKPILSLETDKYKINKDEEVSLAIKIENISIASATLEIYFDIGKLGLISAPENSNYSNNRIIYTWVDETGTGQNNLEIGDFVFKSITSENTAASIIATGEFYDNNGEKIDIENSNLELKLGEENKVIEQSDIPQNHSVEVNNANLQILRLNHVGINPAFSKDIKEYYIVLDDRINELEVTAIPENKNATVTVSGNTNLKNGLNTINIKVEAEDKSKVENYKIYVTKTNNPELSNANLENLAVRDVMLSPEFNSNVTKYKIEVENNTETLDILAVPQRENASVKIEKPEKLQLGDNKIEITVIAEDGITKKKYEIIAHRRDNEEEAKFEEEKEKQEEILNEILEEREDDEKNENYIQDEMEEKNNNVLNILFFVVLVIGVIVFSIYITKRKKK